jgi:putative ABC transport system permease protein
MNASGPPPRLAKWILSHFRYFSLEHLIQSDLEEEFQIQSLGKGRPRAVLWYWGQVLFAIWFNFIRSVSFGGVMLRNYIKITYRSIRRHKLFSFINIAGLATGIASCIFIFIWVHNEQSFNRFHEKIDRIYLVRSQIESGNTISQDSGSPPMLGPALQSEYPEVTNMVRLFHWKPELLMRSGEIVFREKIQFSDPSLFDVFTFLIVKGKPPRGSTNPNELILSERLAERLFGRMDPIGRTITIDNRIDMTVIGVMKDIPLNSSLKFDIWAPLTMTEHIFNLPEFLKSWGNLAFRTYIELNSGVSPEFFSTKISGRIKQADPRASIEPFVYPLKDYYLKLLGHGKKVRMFSVIALLILLMACINFANLSTARSEKRAKEVGIRKVVGAQRILLIRQLLGESILYALISLALALNLVILFLPAFSKLTGLDTTAAGIWLRTPWLPILGLTLLTGLISGVYPAFILSAAPPACTVRGNPHFTQRGGLFRKVLVLTQSALSLVFIICFVVISSQIRFMKTRSPGYSKESILYIPIQGELKNCFAALKTDMLKNPGIEYVSLTTDSPLYIGSIVTNGRWEGKDPNMDPSITLFGTDPDFLDTFDIELVQGRFFDSTTPSQSSDVVINEKLSTFIGTEDAIGAQITSLERNFNVIGIVRDFNFRPLDQELEPLIIFHNDEIMPFRFMFLKLNPDRTPQTIAYLEQLGNRFNLDAPLEYSFLDEEAAAQYENEEKLRRLISVFMGLALLISSLGLFGLSAFMAESRFKEIGIRKVLGASASQVTALLSMNFLKWIFLSNLFAWPAAYIFMSRWLRNFAYKIDLSLWTFAMSAGILAAIGLTTVSIQAMRAALANPVDSLRHE